jgi:hypothetical protein
VHARAIAVITAIAGLSSGLQPRTLYADYDPYVVSRERFRREVGRVVLRPLRVSVEVEDRGELEAALTTRLVDALGRAGLEVLPATEFASRWRRYSEGLGGVYDPSTGAADVERLRLALEYTSRDLVETLSVDAIVTPSVFSRALTPRHPRNGGEITALGASVSWRGRPLKAANNELPQWPQALVGSWLGLDIRDMEGVELYRVGCPIDWRRIYAARSFEDRPDAEVYTPGRLDAAVELCLEDLAPAE